GSCAVFWRAPAREASRTSPSAWSAQRSRFGRFCAILPVDLHRSALRGAPKLQPRLAGALAGVTAAVVGVIFNLSLWFALHVLFSTVSATRHGPLRLWTPDPASLNVEALMLAILAVLLLFGLRFGIVSTLPLTAAASLAWWF